jgi:hypothetical protein
MRRKGVQKDKEGWENEATDPLEVGDEGKGGQKDGEVTLEETGEY